MNPFKLKAPAKVNLCLRVLGKRTDGFHEIESLFYQVSLFDTLTFEHSSANKLLLTCGDETCGPVEQNLVIKAADLLRRSYGVTAGACIHLDKQIPAGAGLGGGSSDAAAALVGLSRLWELNFKDKGEEKELHTLAEQLGSDVPFFLYGPAARVFGRGEMVVPFVPKKPFHLLLVKPDCSVSTAWAYQNLILTNNSLNFRLSCSSLAEGDLGEVAGGLWNDFERTVFKRFPEIQDLKSRLLNAGALGAVMSGSGSSVVGLFDSHDQAVMASKKFGQLWHTTAETLTESVLD